MRIIIADFTTLTKEGKVFGHYAQVAKMYKDIFKFYDVKIAGGSAYKEQFGKELILLKHQIELNEKSVWKKICNKIGTILNGLRLISSTNNSVIIIQPYSFVSNMVSIMLAPKRKNKLFLIEYRYEATSILTKFLFRLVKHKIDGIICSQNTVGNQYKIPYIVMPDYIFIDEDMPISSSENFEYDFGIVGIMSEGKDIESVIRHVNMSNFSLIIAGYFEDDERYRNVIKLVKSDNIKIINRYLDEQEYKKILQKCRFIILPYKEYYRNATSGVIFDTLFNGSPVIAPNYPNFQFLESYGVGKNYEYDFNEINLSEILKNRNMYIENLEAYLRANRAEKNKLFSFMNLEINYKEGIDNCE